MYFERFKDDGNKSDLAKARSKLKQLRAEVEEEAKKKLAEEEKRRTAEEEKAAEEKKAALEKKSSDSESESDEADLSRCDDLSSLVRILKKSNAELSEKVKELEAQVRAK